MNLSLAGHRAAVTGAAGGLVCAAAIGSGKSGMTLHIDGGQVMHS